MKFFFFECAAALTSGRRSSHCLVLVSPTAVPHSGQPAAGILYLSLSHQLCACVADVDGLLQVGLQYYFMRPVVNGQECLVPQCQWIGTRPGTTKYSIGGIDYSPYIVSLSILSYSYAHHSHTLPSSLCYSYVRYGWLDAYISSTLPQLPRIRSISMYASTATRASLPTPAMLRLSARPCTACRYTPCFMQCC